MSWLSGLMDFGKTAYNFVTQNSIGNSLLKTVISGIALNQVSKSINKQSDRATTQQTVADQGVVVSAEASTENKIPVLYGRAVTGGQLIDVRMSNNNQTMHYVYVISERTGNLFSTSAPTAYRFHRAFWSGYEIVFQSDGITAAALKDLQNTTRTDVNGLVKIWFYTNGSGSGQKPEGFTGTVPPAWTVVPEWSASWQMYNLVFAVVEVNYNRAKSITGIGNMSFDVESTMTLPGDVIFDYMTNTRYGAAIPVNNIRT